MSALRTRIASDRQRRPELVRHHRDEAPVGARHLTLAVEGRLQCPAPHACRSSTSGQAHEGRCRSSVLGHREMRPRHRASELQIQFDAAGWAPRRSPGGGRLPRRSRNRQEGLERYMSSTAPAGDRLRASGCARSRSEARLLASKAAKPVRRGLDRRDEPAFRLLAARRCAASLRSRGRRSAARPAFEPASAPSRRGRRRSRDARSACVSGRQLISRHFLCPV